MNTELYERMKALLCEELSVSPEGVTLTSSLVEDLGADSLDIVHLALRVEEHFSIEVDDRDILRLKTVGDVLEFLNARVAS